MNEHEAKLQRLRESIRVEMRAFKEGQDMYAQYAKGNILDCVNPYAEGTGEFLSWNEGLEDAADKFSETHTYDFDQ